MRTTPKNRLVTSLYYAEILDRYNKELRENGKVNKLQFYLNEVKPKVPDYCQRAFYQFVKRFETRAGLVADVAAAPPLPTVPPSAAGSLEKNLKNTLQDSAVATRNLISNMLNIGADAAQEIIDNPQSLPVKERVKFAIQAMKAQDSRIQAVATIKRENREEKAFQKNFEAAAYQDDIIDGEIVE